MENQTFQALLTEEQDGSFKNTIVDRSIDDLPEGDLLVRVSYSSLNYKDALSASGNKGVTRNFPHTPGIDAAGTVVEDATGQYQPGQKVIVTSYDLGMNTDGGFAEYIRVPTEWAVPLPEKMTLIQSMMLGTAGFTAAQSLYALLEKISPDQGEILVTGATGGVGSLAVAMLAKQGFNVCALTGKASAEPYLKSLGASSLIDRQEFIEANKRPMSKTRWAGVIDTVGGDILTSAIKSTQPLGIATCCGMAGSEALNMTVFPFILRGVSLVGIDSQNCPMPVRKLLWNHLADDWMPPQLESLVEEIELADLPGAIELMLSGGHTGRKVVRLG